MQDVQNVSDFASLTCSHMFRALTRLVTTAHVHHLPRYIAVQSVGAARRFLSDAAPDAPEPHSHAANKATTRKNRARSVLDVMSQGDAENRRQLYAPLLAEINQSCKHKDLERGAKALSRMREVCGRVPIEIMSRMAYLYCEGKRPDEVDKIIAEVKASGVDVIESLYTIAVDAHSSVGNTEASVRVRNTCSTLHMLMMTAVHRGNEEQRDPATCAVLQPSEWRIRHYYT